MLLTQLWPSQHTMVTFYLLLYLPFARLENVLWENIPIPKGIIKLNRFIYLWVIELRTIVPNLYLCFCAFFCKYWPLCSKGSWVDRALDWTESNRQSAIFSIQWQDSNPQSWYYGSGVLPLCHWAQLKWANIFPIFSLLVSAAGYEPMILRLRVQCSTTVLVRANV